MHGQEDNQKIEERKYVTNGACVQSHIARGNQGACMNIQVGGQIVFKGPPCPPPPPPPPERNLELEEAGMNANCSCYVRVCDVAQRLHS